MARAIDNKIVQMKMDDSDFTSKVKSVLARFADLNKGFDKVNASNVKGATNSLGELGTKAGDSATQMTKLQSGVESIANKFTVLGQIGQAAIANITNRVVDLGLHVAKEATVQPLIDGYNEYAEKLKSINVIMNNVPGAKLADVKDTLSQLNTYADQTIYSFEDMTSNMGTFTAAGVGLKDSAIAIQGIGNLAASSGSSTQQMSMAMYQLSQALAAGKVGLQDWNSVVNAGMGGQKFQKALSATAKELGHGRNEAVSFRDSLQDGWLTSEVLLKTLAKFKNDKSMQLAATQVKTFADLIDTTKEGLGSAWAQVWENIIGDSEEAPKLWTGIANAIQVPINAMDNYNKNTSKAFHDMGGRQAVIDGLTNVFGSLSKILGTVTDAFRDIFPAPTAKQLVAMAKGFEKFTESLKISQHDLDNIHVTFKAFFSLIKIGINIVKMAAGAIASIIPKNLMSMVLDVTGGIARFILSLESGKSKIAIFNDVVDKFKSGLSGANKVLEAGGSLVDFFVKKIQQMTPTLKDVGKRINDAFGGMFTKLKAQFSSGSIDPSKMIAAGGVAGIALFVKKLSGTFEDLADFFKKGGPLKDVISGAKSVLGGLSDSLNAFTASVKTKAILLISGAMLSLALALKVLASIDAKDVFKSLEMLAAMLFAMNVSLGSLAKMSGSITKAMGAALALNLLALAVDELIVAVYAFGKMDAGTFVQGMSGMAGTIMIMVAAMEVLSKESPKAVASAASLVILAGAVDMIAVAVVALGLIPTSAATQGISAVAALLLSLGVFVRIVEGAKFRMSTAVSIATISSAIIVMSGAIIVLGKMDFNTLATGILALGAILVELGVFAQIAGGAKTGAAAVTLVALSLAIGTITVVLAGLARISFQDLVKGLSALAISLVTMALAMDMSKGSIGGAVALTVLAAALNLLIPPLVILAHLTFMQIVAGLTALAGTLIVLGAAGYLLAPVVPALIGLGGAISLLGVGAALVGVGLSAFAAGLVMLAGLGSAAILAIGGTISSLVDLMVALTPKFEKLAIAWFHALIDAISTQIPYVVASFLKLILGILDALNLYGPQIVQVFFALLINLINVITQNIPTLVTAVANFLIAFAGALGNNAGPVINAGIKLIIDLVNGMANGLRDNQDQIVNAVINAVEAVVEIIITALTRVMQILFGWIPGFSGMVGKAGDNAKNALRDAFGIDQVTSDKGDKAVAALSSKQKPMGQAGSLLAQAGQKGMETLDASGVGGKKGGEFASGVGGKKQDAWNNGSLLAQGAKNGAEGVNLDGTGSNKGQEFVNGLWRQGSGSNGAGKHVASQGADGAGTGNFLQKGKDAGDGYVAGINTKGTAAFQAGSLLAEGMLKGIATKQKSASPSKETRKLGKYAGQGYSLGMDGQQSNVVSSAKNLAGQALAVMADVGEQINEALQSSMDMSPTITPVIDTKNMDMTSFNGSLTPGFFNSYVPNALSQNGQSVATTTVTKTEVHNDQQFHITQQAGESAQQLVDRIQKYIEGGTYA